MADERKAGGAYRPWLLTFTVAPTAGGTARPYFVRLRDRPAGEPAVVAAEIIGLDPAGLMVVRDVGLELGGEPAPEATEIPDLPPICRTIEAVIAATGSHGFYPIFMPSQGPRVGVVAELAGGGMTPPARLWLLPGVPDAYRDDWLIQSRIGPRVVMPGD